MSGLARGERFDRIATKVLTPAASLMARTRTSAGVASWMSIRTGNLMDRIGVDGWTTGSALMRSAELKGFGDYSSLVNDLSARSLVDTMIPKSWKVGMYPSAWSTAEFVKWGYFAVGLHIQVLTGLFYPEVAQMMSGSIPGFAYEFGLSTLLAGAFTYGMLGGHHASHALEAARTYNLERSIQNTVGMKLVEKLPDETVRYRTNTLGFWTELGKMSILGPLGKHDAIVKEGFNYRVNGTPALRVLAAGPRFDKWVARSIGAIGLGMFATSIGLRAAGIEVPHELALWTPKALALGGIAYLGRHQDNNAMFRYADKVKEDARLSALAASGELKADAGKDAIDEAARNSYQTLIGSARNFSVYGGLDPRFAGMEVYAPEGAHNAIQAGKHTEYVDSSGMKGNTSPDLVAQEKWIVLYPKQTDDPNSRGYFGTLQVLPKLQNEIVATVLGTDGISGGGRENEGGCSINCYGGGDMAAIRLMMDAASRAGAKEGYEYGKNIFLGLDNAADSDDLFDHESKVYKWQGQRLSGDELVDRYVDAFYEFKHLLAFEDPFAADRSQWGFWQKLYDRLGDKMLLIGDDILCTNPTTAYDAIRMGAVNSGLIKLNQVGSFAQAWLYMDLFHKKGLGTVISHRSTQPDTLPDPLEVTATLGASYQEKGRVVLAKLGGIYLANRAKLFYEMQRGVEDWRAGNSITAGMGPDAKISSISAFPSPLGAGKYGLMTSMRLSNGIEIVSPIPGGLSRGENETTLLGPKEGSKMVRHIVDELGLVGKPLGYIGNVFGFEQMLMAMDIKMAQAAGKLPEYSKAEWDKFEEEAAFKRFIGGDVVLSLGQLMLKAVAMRDGLPPWLVYRLHGFDLNEKIGFSFENYPVAKQGFYEPIFTGEAGKDAFVR